jgi:hypothetical protein
MITHWFDNQYNTSAGAYLMFAAICLVCAFFSWKMIPETKGISLERISELWYKK